MIKKLTDKVVQEYEIEILHQDFFSIVLGRFIKFYTIQCPKLKVNWSGVGDAWLRAHKKNLLDVINAE